MDTQPAVLIHISIVGYRLVKGDKPAPVEARAEQLIRLQRNTSIT